MTYRITNVRPQFHPFFSIVSPFVVHNRSSTNPFIPNDRSVTHRQTQRITRAEGTPARIGTTGGRNLARTSDHLHHRDWGLPDLCRPCCRGSWSSGRRRRREERGEGG